MFVIGQAITLARPGSIYCYTLQGKMSVYVHFPSVPTIRAVGRSGFGGLRTTPDSFLKI